MFMGSSCVNQAFRPLSIGTCFRAQAELEEKQGHQRSIVGDTIGNNLALSITHLTYTTFCPSSTASFPRTSRKSRIYCLSSKDALSSPSPT